MDFLAVIGSWVGTLLLQMDPDPGVLWGYVQAILEQLGIWVWIQMAMMIAVIIATVRVVFMIAGMNK